MNKLSKYQKLILIVLAWSKCDMKYSFIKEKLGKYIYVPKDWAGPAFYLQTSSFESSFSRSIKRLKDRGLIDLRIDDYDKRQKWIILTEKGLKLAKGLSFDYKTILQLPKING